MAQAALRVEVILAAAPEGMVYLRRLHRLHPHSLAPFFTKIWQEPQMMHQVLHCVVVVRQKLETLAREVLVRAVAASTGQALALITMAGQAVRALFITGFTHNDTCTS